MPDGDDPATRDAAHIPQVLGGTCIWDTPAVGFEEQRASMQSLDPFAWAYFDDLMDAACGDGLAAEYATQVDFRVPLAYVPADVTNPPWLGELKYTGKKKRLWRLYFSETRTGLAVPISIEFKLSTDPRADRKQEDQVRRAMAITKSVFRNRGYEVIPFPGR